MRVKVISRLTNYESVLDDITFIQVKRESVCLPSYQFNSTSTICTIVQLYRNEHVVGIYPVDEYYINISE